MFKTRATRILLAAALVVGVSIPAAATISGSAHDFTAGTWTITEICVPCHTPHNGTTSVTDAPLWNHQVTTATFTLYSTTTLQASMTQPAGVSKLCLSCHDGSVALDSFGGAAGTTFISGTAALGTDLSNDHPVSFLYNTALATADGELHDPATTTAVSDLLFGGNVECASCHDVHNSAGAFPSLLVMSNAGSALCLTCHDK